MGERKLEIREKGVDPLRRLYRETLEINWLIYLREIKWYELEFSPYPIIYIYTRKVPINSKKRDKTKKEQLKNRVCSWRKQQKNRILGIL